MGQIEPCSGEKKGEIIILSDSRLIETIGNESASIQNGNTTISGFRVQIFSGTDRNQCQKMKYDFLETYPDYPIYLSYDAPYFKLRVGDYRNKIEAQKTLHELKLAYEGVLLVPDKINLPELKH